MASLTLVERCCPICGTNSNAKIFAEANIDEKQLDQFAFASRKIPEYMHWRLWLCGQCDLLYSNPAPPPGQLAGLYQQAAFGSAREANDASRTYGRILGKILPQLTDRIGALDIGTGDGAFLNELLDAGFSNVIGIEPSTAPIESAAPRVKAVIRQGLFEDGTFPPETFSLVCCFQTIEHVSDPLGLTREAFRILKPGGAFFLIGHNRRGLSTKVLGRRSPIFDIEHLQLFCRNSVQRMMQSAGFSRVEVSSVWNVYPLSYWSQLFPFPRWFKNPLLSFLRITRIGRIMIPFPPGNLAAVAFKPGI